MLGGINGRTSPRPGSSSRPSPSASHWSGSAAANTRTSPRRPSRPGSRPHLTDTGGHESNPDGPPLRIFTHLDTRVLMEDLYAQLALHADGEH